VNAAVFGHVARQAGRGALGWGAMFGVVVLSSVTGFQSAYPTAAGRTQLARSLAGDSGLTALFGPGRHLDTVGGFAAWRSLGTVTLVGGVWGLLAATRLLRGEEDAGRWELLLAGRTTRRRAAAEGLLGLAGGWAVMWATVAVIAVAAGRSQGAGLPVSGALYLSLALVASAGVFLAIGALASQLAPTRRRAASLASGVLGVSFLVRMIADSGTSRSWLRWFTPLGWIEELRPLTGSRTGPLIPLAGLVAVVSAAAVVLAGRRDLGASTLPDRDTAEPRLGLLNGPWGLTARLARPVALGWVAAVALSGLVFGLIAEGAAQAVSGSTAMQRALARLGVRASGAAVYLGLCFVILSALIGLVAAGQVAAAREEEAEGRLDSLLVQPLGRLRWLGGRVAVAAALVTVLAVVGGIGAWVGAAAQGTAISLARLVAAGLNIAPVGLFVLGFGVLLHGVSPRIAAGAAYGLVAWSFLIEMVGAVVKANHWMLDLSLLHHVAPAPAADPRWTSGAVLVALGAAAALIGAACFDRRDLVGR